MQQYQVPQFITVEDKIIGPFTAKQFVFLAAGGLLIVFLKSIFEGFILYTFVVLIGAFAAALAFLKINEQPFPSVIKNAFLYMSNPRLYVWKQETQKQKSEKAKTKNTTEETTVKIVPKLSTSKLSDLSWSLDLKDKIRQENP